MKLVGPLLALAIGFGAALLVNGETSATAPASQAATTSATQRKDPPRFTSAKYLELHEKNKLRAKEGNVDVVFLGDSITSGWIGHGREAWKTHLAPLNTVNFGIGLDTPAKLIWRIEDGTLDGIAPKVVVLLIGTNTLGPKVGAADKQVVEAIQKKLPASKILIMGILPRKGENDPPTTEENRIKGNAELAKLDDGKTIRFLDLSDAMAPDGKFDASYFVSDKIHLSKKGYDLWAERAAPVIKEMMK